MGCSWGLKRRLAVISCSITVMKVNFRSHGHVQVFGGTGCHPDWAGAELRGAAAAVGCGLQPEPCRAAVSLPQGTRAQPELPLELQWPVHSHLLPPPPLDTGLRLARAAQAAAACESPSQHAPGTLPEASLEEDGEPTSFIPPTQHFCFKG